MVDKITIQLIRQKCIEGRTPNQLASDFDCSLSSIYRYTEGIPHLGQHICKYSPEFVESIRDKYQSGYNPRELMREYSLSRNQVYYFLGDLPKKRRLEQVANVREKIGKLSDFEIGFITGLLEGEGSCLIRAQMARDKVSAHPMIEITNNQLELLNYVYDRVGGRIDVNKKERKTYYWHLTQRESCYIFLKTIYPYLVSPKKKATATAVLEFIELRAPKKLNEPLQEEELKCILRYYEAANFITGRRVIKRDEQIRKLLGVN